MPGVRQAGGVSVHTRARRAVGPHALLAVLVRGATKATGDTRGMTHVQAMETHYKGFRFRSRLEARWAMFFDMTGVKWTFEPQPVTVFGEPYLPDVVAVDAFAARSIWRGTGGVFAATTALGDHVADQ